MYKEIKAYLKYGREKNMIDIVIFAIKTKELEILSQKKEQSNGEGLYSKGKSKKKKSEG